MSPKFVEAQEEKKQGGSPKAETLFSMNDLLLKTANSSGDDAFTLGLECHDAGAQVCQSRVELEVIEVDGVDSEEYRNGAADWEDDASDEDEGEEKKKPSPRAVETKEEIKNKS